MRHAIKEITLLVVIFVCALSISAVANTFSDGHLEQSAGVIEGRVNVISPDAIKLETSRGLVSVNVDALDVEDMDVQFLQIGDIMIVDGRYESSRSFEAEELIDIEPSV